MSEHCRCCRLNCIWFYINKWQIKLTNSACLYPFGKVVFYNQARTTENKIVECSCSEDDDLVVRLRCWTAHFHQTRKIRPSWVVVVCQKQNKSIIKNIQVTSWGKCRSLPETSSTIFSKAVAGWAQVLKTTFFSEPAVSVRAVPMASLVLGRDYK